MKFFNWESINNNVKMIRFEHGDISGRLYVYWYGKGYEGGYRVGADHVVGTDVVDHIDIIHDIKKMPTLKAAKAGAREWLNGRINLTAICGLTE